jgi:hypothetical protein
LPAASRPSPKRCRSIRQAPNPSGGYDKSSWFPPDGLDGDQYVWDSFVLGSNQTINQLRWRGCYTNYLSGAGESPVFAFTISIWGGIEAGIQPDVTASPLVQYTINGNAGETPAGTFGGVQMYDYHANVPGGFKAVAGTQYWVQIEACQGLTPTYSWPPDWSLAYGTGGDGSHFREVIGGSLAGGNAYQLISGDIAFSVLTSANGSGIVVKPAAMTQILVGGFPVQTKAGAVGHVTVTAADAFGNPVPAYTGTVHFSSSDPKAVLPGDYTFTSKDNGKHTFAVTFKTAGAGQSITAADTVTPTFQGTQTGINVVAAAASQVQIAAPATVTSGNAFLITLTALDAYGNIAQAYTGTVHFTSSDTLALLPANYTFTGGDAGAHTFSVTLATVGSQKLTATDTVKSAIHGSATLTVNSAPVAPHLVTPTSGTGPKTPGLNRPAIDRLMETELLASADLYGD